MTLLQQWKPSENLPAVHVPVLGYWPTSGNDPEHWAIVTINKPDGLSWLVCDHGVYDTWSDCDAPDVWFELPEVSK